MGVAGRSNTCGPVKPRRFWRQGVPLRKASGRPSRPVISSERCKKPLHNSLREENAELAQAGSSLSSQYAELFAAEGTRAGPATDREDAANRSLAGGMIPLTDETSRAGTNPVTARTIKSGRGRVFSIHKQLQTALGNPAAAGRLPCVPRPARRQSEARHRASHAHHGGAATAGGTIPRPRKGSVVSRSADCTPSGISSARP